MENDLAEVVCHSVHTIQLSAQSKDHEREVDQMVNRQIAFENLVYQDLHQHHLQHLKHDYPNQLSSYRCE